MSLKYKFGYDIDGFFSGLVRADSNGIFPNRSVDVEPNWKDGFKPRWNDHILRWEQVKRDDCVVVRAENFVLGEVRREIDSTVKIHSEILHDDILELKENLKLSSYETARSLELNFENKNLLNLIINKVNQVSENHLSYENSVDKMYAEMFAQIKKSQIPFYVKFWDFIKNIFS